MAKVLLVEDDTNLSEIYQARLEAEGYDVVAAPDGETALALAAKEKPDLILSDVMMPKISGFEMLDILRNTDGLKHTKVIMLTALGQAEDKARAEQLGADRYLVKSQVTLEDIVSAAKALLNEDNPAPMSPSNPVTDNSADNSIGATTTLDPAATDTTAVAMPVIEPMPLQTAPTGPLEATQPVVVVQEAPTPMPAAAMPMVDDTSVLATPLTPAPASDPVAPTPDPISTVAPAPVAAAEPQAQPTAEEAAIVQNQIAGFAEQQPEQPAQQIEQSTKSSREQQPAAELSQPVEPQTNVPAPEPVASLVEPPAAENAPATAALPTDQPVTAPPSPAPAEIAAPPAAAQAPTPMPTAAAIDEKVVANAIDKLLAKAPSHTSGAAISPHSSTEKPRKKIISPISHPKELSLEELLAKEEARTTVPSQATALVSTAAATPAAITADLAPTPTGAPSAAISSTQPAADPSEDAAAQALAQAKAAKAAKDNGQAGSDDFDPNSIAL